MSKYAPQALPRTPVAKPARPVEALLNEMPLPVGGINLAKVSPAEQERLAKLGVAGQVFLPANFTELAERAVHLATHDDAIPLPENAPARPLTVQEIDVDKLPPESRAKYQVLIDRAIKQAKDLLEQEAQSSTMDRSVAAAVAAGNAPVPVHQSTSRMTVVDDSTAPRYASGAPKTAAEPAVAAPAAPPSPEPAPPASQPSQKPFCVRCGFPKDRDEDLLLEPMDEEVYFDCLLSGKPFQKTFSAYQGRMSICVRGLTTKDLAAIRRQLAADARSDNYPTDLELRIRGDELQLCMQLVSIHAGNKPVLECPDNLDDWRQVGNVQTPGDIAKLLLENELRSSTMYRLAQTYVNKFNAIEHKLEQLSQAESFFEAGSTES